MTKMEKIIAGTLTSTLLMFGFVSMMDVQDKADELVIKIEQRNNSITNLQTELGYDMSIR